MGAVDAPGVVCLPESRSIPETRDSRATTRALRFPGDSANRRCRTQRPETPRAFEFPESPEMSAGALQPTRWGSGAEGVPNTVGFHPTPRALRAASENILDVKDGLPAVSAKPPAERSRILGRLRRLGARDMNREASVLKALRSRHPVSDIELALDGLEILFPGQPISLRMIHGKSMMGSYRGFQSAVNAAIKAQESRE